MSLRGVRYFRVAKLLDAMRLFRCFLALVVPQLLSVAAVAQYVSTWDPDADGDNFITVNDLIAVLSVFEEGDSDDDGIFDSQDSCVGTIDVCGVCAGPGATVPVLDQIIFVTDSVYQPAVGTWYVFSYAVDTLYTYVCPVEGCTLAAAWNFNPAANVDDGSCTWGPPECGGQSSVTFDDYTYPLVAIGSQCWFKENLRSDAYRNGDAIPGSLSNTQWSNASQGAQTVYNSDGSNLASYGRLYNWHAVNDARGLCPTGFHVPTDAEWTQLELALGGSATAGHALKSTSLETPPWNGTNSSGFKGVPAGYRFSSNGLYYDLGSYSYFWSASSSGTSAWGRGLATINTLVYRTSFNVRYGFAVRCVRD